MLSLGWGSHHHLWLVPLLLSLSGQALDCASYHYNVFWCSDLLFSQSSLNLFPEPLKGPDLYNAIHCLFQPLLPLLHCQIVLSRCSNHDPSLHQSTHCFCTTFRVKYLFSAGFKVFHAQIPVPSLLFSTSALFLAKLKSCFLFLAFPYQVRMTFRIWNEILIQIITRMDSEPAVVYESVWVHFK